MNWSEVVMITFSCVAANHLGLVPAIEQTLHCRLPIINCPKCFTFWALVIYGIATREPPITIVAASFLFAYLATWLNLLFAIIDYLYNYIYDTLYPAADTTADNSLDTTGTMSDVSEEESCDKTAANDKEGNNL